MSSTHNIGAQYPATNTVAQKTYNNVRYSTFFKINQYFTRIPRDLWTSAGKKIFGDHVLKISCTFTLLISNSLTIYWEEKNNGYNSYFYWRGDWIPRSASNLACACSWDTAWDGSTLDLWKRTNSFTQHFE